MSDLILYGTGILVAILMTVFQIRKAKKKRYIPAEIIQRYNKIQVDSKKIEVLSRKYFEEVDNGHATMSQAFDALYDGERNYSKRERIISVLVCKDYFLKGKNIRLKSDAIDDIEESYIKAMLKRQKNVTVYLNPGDIENHYFDLSFIYE